MPRVRLEDTRDWQLADRSHDVRGRELRDSVGRALGTIKTMIVDTDARRVEAVVLEDETEYPVRDLQIMEQAVYFIPSMPGAMAAAPDAPPEPTVQVEGETPADAATMPHADISDIESAPVHAAPEAPAWHPPETVTPEAAPWAPAAGSGAWSPPAADTTPMPPAMEPEVAASPAWSPPTYAPPAYTAPPPPPPYVAPELDAEADAFASDPAVPPPAAPDLAETYPAVPPPAPPAGPGAFDPLADPFAPPPAAPGPLSGAAPYAEPIGSGDYVPSETPRPAADRWFTPAEPGTPASGAPAEAPPSLPDEDGWTAPPEAPPPPPAADAWTAPADVEPREEGAFTAAGLTAGGLAAGGFSSPPELPQEEPRSDFAEPDDRPVEPFVAGGSPVVAPAEPGHAPGPYAGVAPEPGFPTHAAPAEAAAGHTLHEVPAETPPPMPPAAADADDAFRSHFSDRYADAGSSYDEMAGPYRFGADAASDPELRDADDDTLRRRFNERHGYDPDDRWAWLGARDAVRRGMGR
jgi:hypothetical protein